LAVGTGISIVGMHVAMDCWWPAAGAYRWRLTRGVVAADSSAGRGLRIIGVTAWRHEAATRANVSE